MTDSTAPRLSRARRGPAGERVWSARSGDASTQVGIDVAADAGGGALIAGRHDGTINFGQGALSGAGQGDAFVAKLSLP